MEEAFSPAVEQSVDKVVLISFHFFVFILGFSSIFSKYKFSFKGSHQSKFLFLVFISCSAQFSKSYVFILAKFSPVFSSSSHCDNFSAVVFY